MHSMICKDKLIANGRELCRRSRQIESALKSTISAFATRKFSKVVLFCGALVLLAVSQCSHGCSMAYGHAPKGMTREEWHAEADLVLSGRVIQIESAPKLGRTVFKITFEVEHWLKGTGGKELLVFDDSGNPCDRVHGVFHILEANDPKSVRWLVYATKRQKQYWVSSAYRVDRPE